MEVESLTSLFVACRIGRFGRQEMPRVRFPAVPILAAAATAAFVRSSSPHTQRTNSLTFIHLGFDFGFLSAPPTGRLFIHSISPDGHSQHGPYRKSVYSVNSLAALPKVDTCNTSRSRQAGVPADDVRCQIVLQPSQKCRP